jgi:hypothetical protein
MTKKEWDRITKTNYGGRMGNRTQYRRERGFVTANDILANRIPGRIEYSAALRAIGAGRGSSKLRQTVWKYEKGR